MIPLSGQAATAFRAPAWWRALLFVAFVLAAQTSRGEEIYQIKAAFIFNFTKFISWPAELEQAGGDLRLCMLDGNPFGDYVYQLNGRRVRNFYLRVSETKSRDQLSMCHIVYLSDPKVDSELLSALASLPILTISDVDGFMPAGGGISLFPENERIRFDINLQRLKSCGLDVSSKLLSLARQVH